MFILSILRVAVSLFWLRRSPAERGEAGLCIQCHSVVKNGLINQCKSIKSALSASISFCFESVNSSLRRHTSMGESWCFIHNSSLRRNSSMGESAKQNLWLRNLKL